MVRCSCAGGSALSIASEEFDLAQGVTSLARQDAVAPMEAAMLGLTELKHRLDRLWQRHLALKELRQLDPATRAATGRDMGVSTYRLERLAASGRRDTSPLTRLFAALGLDRTQLEREEPQVSRDLEIACAECGSERRCVRDLDAGRSPREFHKYCPNVVELAALLKARGIHTIPAQRPKERRRPF
jgi:hypothetical protein